MKLQTYLASIFFAGALTAFPAQGPAQDDASNLMLREAMLAAEEFAQPFEVAITYCYRGSIVDPTTGEILDLYGVCDDALGENLDLA